MSGWFTSRRKAKQALVDAGKDASEQWDLDILEFDDKDQANPIAKQSEKTLDDLLTPSGRSDGRSDSVDDLILDKLIPLLGKPTPA